MSLPEYEHEWQAEVDALRAEVAALRERVGQDWWERAMVAERELAEARAEVKRLQDPEALGAGWFTARAWKAKYDEALALLARVREVTASCDWCAPLLRGDEARPEPQSNVHCDDQECWCATARDEATGEPCRCVFRRQGGVDPKCELHGDEAPGGD